MDIKPEDYFDLNILVDKLEKDSSLLKPMEVLNEDENEEDTLVAEWYKVTYKVTP